MILNITDIAAFIQEWVLGLDGEAVLDILKEHFDIIGEYKGDGFFFFNSPDAMEVFFPEWYSK